MIYSTAAIQWIPENIAFSKTFKLLKSSGTPAMDLSSQQPQMYRDMQNFYDKYFKTENNSNGCFAYDNVLNYGFINLGTHVFRGIKEFSSEKYVNYFSTHSDHIAHKEPFRTPFFKGTKGTIKNHGNKLVINSEHILKTVKKAQ